MACLLCSTVLVMHCSTGTICCSVCSCGLTAYLSYYSSASKASWHAQLTDFLDEQWSLLIPSTQNAIALEFSCCGFNDPVLVPHSQLSIDVINSLSIHLHLFQPCANLTILQTLLAPPS
ncbi:hypothetical protein PF005_g18464 [Phytophthora fragariae]|uniref:Secreted protein n=1 Tax=Phytophthora fragariae TaxID=53985 RepID=A0A6A3R9Q5_9STRA|nr:hypothetical protein PF003_g9880 [Phytophthora fragariae]KAE8930498.1 hypothetical protein PF009_g19411 [Phytophthora fragariae]KAE9092347.1 hypothetical protein PF007_g18543 [Phytophthora fragariae]KAE9123448.1 hypothetical protein PF006_g17419 [Phytophthora fragariae]KAE9192412.1 hypothetical protein PF005_g18464 [Phytophthora fragariae]